jgi:hypothetical protein
MISVFVALAALICAGVLLISPSEPTATAVISKYGLRLTLSLDSTTYHPGEQISITIGEKNTLPIENNISAADEWPVQGLYLEPCTVYPFGISILQGYYDAKNVTAVTPLQLFSPNVMYSCAVGPPVSYDFQPWSDIAAIYTSCDSEPWSINMTAKVTSAGFWTVTHGHPTWTFSNFTPGIYTVVGGDEWGALVILHFTIS